MYKRQVVETQDDRARGPTPRPQEVSLHMLMELINEKFDKQSENNRLINEKLEKQSEKLDQHKKK